jgi:hypothetical protein
LYARAPPQQQVLQVLQALRLGKRLWTPRRQELQVLQALRQR